MAADSTSSAVRQFVISEADPFEDPILMDGIDEVIRKAGNWSLMPTIEDENGTLRVLVDPKYLPRPRAPQAPAVVPQASARSKLDELYAPHFRRLEQGLEALVCHVPPVVTEGKITDPKYLPRPRAPQAPAVVPQASPRSKLDELYAPHFQRLEQGLEALVRHVPPVVTEGKVATLGLAREFNGGAAVFEPTLEDHKAAPTK